MIIDINTLAVISDKALDNAYHYGLSSPGSFGYEANKSSAQAVYDLLITGEKNIEVLSNGVHEGWGKIAKSYDDPMYAVKPQKKINRLTLANTSYYALPEEEKEKDRVIVRAIANYLNISL